jgi:hypothetical protein
MGDYTPYLLVTHDFGKTWSNIGKNLPSGTWYARSVRQDLHNPNIVYAGTETGMFISCDAGASWHDFKNNLPTVAVRDIRYQSTWNDMAIATHGRALYVMDDLRPIQMEACSTPSQPFVIGPRVSYQYSLHGNDEGIYTDYAGSNPEYGSIFWYYQPTPGAQAPVLQILDHGRVIRTVQGNREPSPFAPPSADTKPKPKIPNGAGLQSFTWGYAVDGPVKWNGAGRFFKGPDAGATVPPGIYGYRMTVDGKTFSGNFVVKADPSTHFTQAEMVASYEFSNRMFAKLSALDVALNSLDDVRAALTKKNDTVGLAHLQDIQDLLTANYQGFEDFVQRSGKLREDLMSMAGAGLITPAVLNAEQRMNAEWATDAQAFNVYIQTLPADVPRPKPLPL